MNISMLTISETASFMLGGEIPTSTVTEISSCRRITIFWDKAVYSKTNPMDENTN